MSIFDVECFPCLEADAGDYSIFSDERLGCWFKKQPLVGGSLFRGGAH